MFLDQTTPLIRDAERTGSRVRLLFTGRAKKDQALQALEQLRAILADSRVTELGQELDRAARRGRSPPRTRRADLWRRYVDDAASVNALLSTAVAEATHDEAEAARGFVPEELRQQVTAEPLDTTFLTATLRGYQVFGAQYAIHQQRAILGDEMGLGKTVQALAAVAHLAARDQRRFLVVCPASVQINWLNETRKHTRLKAYSLHGADRDAGRADAGCARVGSRSPPSAPCPGCRPTWPAPTWPCSWSTRRTSSRTRTRPARGPWPTPSTGRSACCSSPARRWRTGSRSSATWWRISARRSPRGWTPATCWPGRGASAARSRRCTCGATPTTCSTSSPRRSRSRTGCCCRPRTRRRTRRPSARAT